MANRIIFALQNIFQCQAASRNQYKNRKAQQRRSEERAVCRTTWNAASASANKQAAYNRSPAPLHGMRAAACA